MPKKPKKSRTPQRQPRRYHLRINDSVKGQIRNAPGNVRQRLRRVVDGLGDDPRPSGSQPMTAPPDMTVELRRIRLDDWRIVYLIDEAESAVGVLTVRQRPPYDYADLTEVVKQFNPTEVVKQFDP